MRDPITGAGTQRMFVVLAIGLLAGSVALTTPAVAQDVGSVPWGQLSTTELRDRLDEDPSASASVVFDRGLITVGPGFKFTYEHHRRIQIFGPAAYSLANVEILYHSSEKIASLEGHTLTPDGRRVELRREHIYETKAGNLVTRVFAFPEVGPGCVIEYRYKLESRNFYYLRPWAFQSDIPTEYSELAVRLPEGFEYEAVLNNSDFVSGPDTTEYTSIRHKKLKVQQFTWRSSHLAPLVGETCVSSLLDHRVQLDFQIVRYRDDDGKIWEFVDSWSDLAKQVKNVYKPLLRSDEHWPRWGNGCEDADCRYRLVRRIYSFVRDSVAQSGVVRAVAAGALRSARDVYKQRRGNALEKNLLLVALLRHNGFDAYPFLISRRNHLRFDRRDHRLDQFDHAIVMIEDNERIFCDANTPGAWLGYLPPEDLVDAGVVIGYRKSDDVVLDMPAPSVSDQAIGTATITLNTDGSATGTLDAEVSGRAAHILLVALADRDTVAYLHENWLPEIEPRSIEVIRPLDDEWAPITIKVEFDWASAADVSDGRLFVRPSTLRKLKTNPLMTSTRRFPISFDTPWDEVCRVIWNFPEGHEFNALPTNRELVGDGFEFRSTFEMIDGQLVANRVWRVTRRDFPVGRFKDLRELFNSVELSQRGLLVLYSDTF